MALNLTIEREDKQKASDGVWCDYGNGVKMKIRRISCPESVAVRNRLIAELKEGYKGDKVIDEEDASAMGSKIIAEAIIVDWEGISEIDDDGKEIEYPYNYENAYNMLTDDAYMALFIWISEQANRFENYRYNIRKRDEKKSES